MPDQGLRLSAAHQTSRLFLVRIEAYFFLNIQEEAMSFVRRIGITRMLTVVALVALAVPGHTVQAAPSPQGGQTVKMVDFAFQPKTLTVPVGATVTWSNAGKAPHTATSDTGVFDTGNVDAGATSKSVTFSKPGAYPYYCKYHGGPKGVGMAGMIVVTAAQAQPQPVATTAPAAPAAPAAPVASAGLRPSLMVHNQSIINSTITVDRVVAAQEGWVAVHMFGPDGKLLLTPLAGLTQVKAGTSSNVQIKLDKSFNVGDKLMPMLHIDAGARGKYEFPNGPDVPVTIGDQIVMMQFTVQAGAGAPATMPATGASGDRLPLLLDLGVLTLLAGLAVSVTLRRRNSGR
jgi:plastocyanin